MCPLSNQTTSHYHTKVKWEIIGLMNIAYTFKGVLIQLVFLSIFNEDIRDSNHLFSNHRIITYYL